jgi:hypothetical protein
MRTTSEHTCASAGVLLVRSGSAFPPWPRPPLQSLNVLASKEQCQRVRADRSRNFIFDDAQWPHEPRSLLLAGGPFIGRHPTAPPSRRHWHISTPHAATCLTPPPSSALIHVEASPAPRLLDETLARGAW